MKGTIEIQGVHYAVDYSKPMDISIAISGAGPRAWYAEPASISPVIDQKFTGSVVLGGSVNFRDVHMNPHAHGTHTESVGHITRELNSVNQLLGSYYFSAQLVTLAPSVVKSSSPFQQVGDRVITRDQLENVLTRDVDAFIVRTLPNPEEKKHKNYSHTNFPYFDPGAMELLVEKNVRHLLTDLPSVDREEDGGRLLAHRAFWNYPKATRYDCTITEFIYAADSIPDGLYLLNLQVAAIENDAAPSRPVLFECKKIN